MTGVFVAGIGAVSPAGWGVPALREALNANVPIPVKEAAREGVQRPLRARKVPPPPVRPEFFGHPRLRRTSAITQFTVTAAREALGADVSRVADGSFQLGLVYCVGTGCMSYCRRFYDEVVRDPSTASPLVFPETVFNAPSSHLAAQLGTTAINYTLVGDSSTFLAGLALGANWLLEGRVAGVIIVGAEESEWIALDAFRRFSRDAVLADGAGAVYLKLPPTGGNGIELAGVTDAQMYFDQRGRREAMRRVRSELPAGGAEDLLCDGRIGVPRLDLPEEQAWRGWPGRRISPLTVLGEGFAASVAWQCTVAVDLLGRQKIPRAIVSTAGDNASAIGAVFQRGECSAGRSSDVAGATTKESKP